MDDKDAHTPRPGAGYDRSAESRYRPFSSAAVAAALSVSVLGGFGLACVLSVSVGLQLSVGNWWLPVLQAHGHIQLVAWLGLFIIGVSLYFVPRLAGAPLRHPGLVPWVVGAVTLGVVMRGSAQVGLALWPASFASRTGLAMSGWLELVGIAGYLFLLISSVRAAEGRVALASVRVYFGTAFVGWAAYGLLNALLTVRAALDGVPVVDLALNRFASDLFAAFVLLPVTFAFSIRTFPLYLRLPAPDWPISMFGAVYLGASVAAWGPEGLRMAGWAPTGGELVSSAGHVVRGIVILGITAQLDVLTRFRAPWTTKRIGHPGPERRPTRPGLPDYGEFGRFEGFLYLAYAWLAVAAVAEVVNGVWGLAGSAVVVEADALRHTVLAGFVSSLLLGMAPRMVPGFLRRRRLAHPVLVAVSFVLWVPATVGRVGLLYVADFLPESALPVGMLVFAASGILGLGAVVVLGVNLFTTARS